MPEKRSGLKTGHRYEFVCLQIDIAGHSELSDAERKLHAAKRRFHGQIDGIVATYGGQPFKWEGDGGAFLFHVTDGKEFDEAVFAAFRILESLPSINEEIRMTAGLSQALSVRVSLDSGPAVFDRNPGLIAGDFLNAFLKHERAVGRVGAVAITERVHRQISESLRKRFTEPEVSSELGCPVYRTANSGTKELPGHSLAGSANEPTAVNDGENLRVSINGSVKVPHHGSIHSNFPDCGPLCDRVKSPGSGATLVPIISGGYLPKLPHEATVESLLRCAGEYYMTGGGAEEARRPHEPLHPDAGVRSMVATDGFASELTPVSRPGRGDIRVDCFPDGRYEVTAENP